MHERENVQRREILELEEMKKKIFTEKKLLQSEIDEKIATECDDEDKGNDAGEEDDEEELVDPNESIFDDESSSDDSSEDDDESVESVESEADESKADGLFSKYTLDASPRNTQRDVTTVMVKSELETDVYNGDTLIIGEISSSKFMSFVKSTDPSITFISKSLFEQFPGNNLTRIDTLRLMTIKKMYPSLKFKAVGLNNFINGTSVDIIIKNK